MDNVMDNVSENNQIQAESTQVTEKMVPQSQVNEIVGNAKREAADRAVEAYKRQQTQSAPSQAPQYSETSGRSVISDDDIARVTDDRIKQHFTKIEQEAQERANVDAANRIVGMFRDKIGAGKEKFEDFESVTGSVAMQFYPNVVQLLAEQVDNAADVLYHLSKNRDTMYRIEGLSEHNRSDAIYEIKRLAESIKLNEESSGKKHPNQPLSQQRPSNTGTDSGGALSFADLKRKYRA